jgi:hypothetical protein
MLEHFFGSKTRVKLLYIFFREPERPFFVRELARLIDIQLNAVRRELSNLERFGIVRHVSPGTMSKHVLLDRSKYYQLDSGHVLFAELKAFLTKAYVLEQKQVIESILKSAGDVHYCLLTGSFMRIAAPTDMLLVGDLTVPALEKTIAKFEHDSGETLRYTLMDEHEFNERLSCGDVFLTHIFESPHSVIVDKIIKK